MSRTLNQLDLGTSVYIEENGTPKEYILMKKDVDGCILLRAQALEARRINPPNVSNYENSEMDNWLINEETGYMSLFNTATKNAIISRSRPTYDFGDSECRWISRRAFLLTQGELFNSTPSAVEPLTTLFPVLSLWNPTLGRICKNESDAAVFWWLSSSSSATRVCNVSYSGTLSSDSASSPSNWARPALNVASATIVSDEGADRIYLLPTQEYRVVDFSGELLSTTKNYKKAVVTYNATNLYDVSVQITNNYGDNTPVWVDATPQGVVEFTNTEKTTDEWKIGVRCFGKSNGYGYFDEPIIKMI